jgi:hypothetical protein
MPPTTVVCSRRDVNRLSVYLDLFIKRRTNRQQGQQSCVKQLACYKPRSPERHARVECAKLNACMACGIMQGKTCLWRAQHEEETNLTYAQRFILGYDKTSHHGDVVAEQTSSVVAST